MITTIIKSFLLFLFTFYFFNKIICTGKYSLSQTLKEFISSFLLALLTLLCKQKFVFLSYTLPFLFFWIAVCFMSNFKPKFLFICSLISYCIVLTLYNVSAIIWGILTYPILSELSQTVIYLFTILSSITTFFLLELLLKLKKSRYAINYLLHNSVFNYGSFLCCLCVIILTFEQVYSTKIVFVSSLRMLSIVVLLLLLNFWWRSQITKTYREKLRLLEMKTLRAAKAENEAYISKLEAENRRLGTIIHKDNRIVNAMADSVCDYLTSSGSTNAEELHEKGVSLSNEINSIKTYRQELLCEGSLSETSTPQTNHAGVDAIIAFMVKEAASYGITLKFHYDKDFFSAKRFTATEMDFVHLLSDLLENAIIATRHAKGQSIELSLQILKGTPAISVSDSGIPFEINTLMKFGLCEASTHIDEGGTGIGLIDIWSFKKKYHASLVIEELDNSIYSKRLSLLFDGKNKYLIISNRFQQIISSQTRADLLVINATANELTELVED